MQWLLEHAHFEIGTAEVLSGEVASGPLQDRSRSLGTAKACSLDDSSSQRYRATTARNNDNPTASCSQSGAGRPVAAARAAAGDPARALAPSQSGGDCQQLANRPNLVLFYGSPILYDIYCTKL
jgi:hypothetical protein